jgi:hypothetical protein
MRLKRELRLGVENSPDRSIKNPTRLRACGVPQVTFI